MGPGDSVLEILQTTPVPAGDGLGAGFFGLTTLVVIWCLSILIALVGFVSSRRPSMALRYGIAGLFATVVVVAAFSVLMVYDAAGGLTSVYVFTVFLPVVIVVGATYDGEWLDTLITTAIAWAIPFTVGVWVTVFTPRFMRWAFGLSPLESQRTAWIGALVVGIAISAIAYRLAAN